MGKITQLIDELSGNGQANPAATEALSMLGRRASRQLRQSLLAHHDPLVREICAELIGELGDTKAVPDLIEALKDPSAHVRWDALRALEKLLWIQLGWWLEAEAYKDSPQKLYTRARNWWKRHESEVWW